MGEFPLRVHCHCARLAGTVPAMEVWRGAKKEEHVCCWLNVERKKISRFLFGAETK
jgi:hypothetical protein